MKCLWCGKPFTPATTGQLFCSKDRPRAAKVPRAVRIQAAKDAANQSTQTLNKG